MDRAEVARLVHPARRSCVALWSFFWCRRMGGAEGGVMSFARSRAKIYSDDDVKVRFIDVAASMKPKRNCARSSNS
jgi:ATP-dependent Zn protease